MFDIRYEGLTHNEELQIVQADVRVVAEGETLVEEPLCIDVGLPALLASAFEETRPDRFADAAVAWERMPFFVCGCGDPDCRAMPFAVRHEAGEVVWTELDQSPSGARVLGEYRIPLTDYRRALRRLGEAFLAFAEPLDYRPLQPDTVKLIRAWTERLRRADGE
ncbi:hypothetical protein FE782_03480 [Paenibacillus antri]|uniref:Uncharacterized protein n=1 Tax=Paenibacillus antri TaxID=2582848 RepID=A0A5R9GIV7_9BACL|nr:hypothetical protein [Paenibacillus antri]TLS53348.1 hypothetical protein FE782_03480 [Paenibacillus antri]